ncbi:MG(2+) CHELATASE FAMILY PROTEIN / ComM-related protein [Rhodovastum atsumiense]|uniref:YifB family Mg chelatase-like AAA ATPase n=1 Tax=Rhodovastum atsumiense TaxID=504468 RepID=A0A5M6IXG5_9PROT|nr:YifB family Mg chelatase-like AAA ATPase [Rhodovastum atsumiense]KAA5612065.1 YifB family Mg chelatase-like AAA ATPase [Rhodovastum atsumiense]CAH2604066.1 MG(2+) CHELATASE FAMILY PROTEIN / ComM-related protein [Rhodovastum atsumiense]
MTIARVQCFTFSGIEAVPVEVQVQISRGLPAFLVVGLADKAVAEARERVRAALSAMGLSLPPKRVLINLAPADLLKEGSHFDLPIALAVLAAMEVLPREEVGEYAALGELSLDGSLNPVAGVLPAAIGASALGLGLVCPAAQGGEAAWAGDIRVLAAPDLLGIVNHFKGLQVLSPPELAGRAPASAAPDLAEVRGLETARRALEIAAAGAHNLLFVGPPGSGKSMLAARLPGLLPDLSPLEALEVSMIHSVAGILDGGRLVMRPPFRDPHHSASQAALTGGGHRARPGEISLAHRGVLFLDELPEFPRATLEALRQPMETGRTTVSRASAHVTYPARFQLIAAMNPCRCGYLGNAARECGRAPRCGEEYRMRISGPLLDRIDLVVEVEAASPAALSRAPPGEASGPVATRVAAARERQRVRAGTAGPVTNAEADATQFALVPEARTLAEQAAERLGLSNRGFIRTLRVARSIADLAGAEAIRRTDIAEALAYRPRISERRG